MQAGIHAACNQRLVGSCMVPASAAMSFALEARRAVRSPLTLALSACSIHALGHSELLRLLAREFSILTDVTGALSTCRTCATTLHLESHLSILT